MNHIKIYSSRNFVVRNMENMNLNRAPDRLNRFK